MFLFAAVNLIFGNSQLSSEERFLFLKSADEFFGWGVSKVAVFNIRVSRLKSGSVVGALLESKGRQIARWLAVKYTINV